MKIDYGQPKQLVGLDSRWYFNMMFTGSPLVHVHKSKSTTIKKYFNDKNNCH